MVLLAGGKKNRWRSSSRDTKNLNFSHRYLIEKKFNYSEPSKNRWLKKKFALFTEEGYNRAFRSWGSVFFLNKSIENSTKSIDLMMATKVNRLEKKES